MLRENLCSGHQCCRSIHSHKKFEGKRKLQICNLDALHPCKPTASKAALLTVHLCLVTQPLCSSCFEVRVDVLFALDLSREPREEVRENQSRGTRVTCVGTLAQNVNAIYRMADGTPILATHRIKGVEEKLIERFQKLGVLKVRVLGGKSLKMYITVWFFSSLKCKCCLCRHGGWRIRPGGAAGGWLRCRWCTLDSTTPGQPTASTGAPLNAHKS